MFWLVTALSVHVAPHPELGRVHWLKDFEGARQRARSSGKPLLVLFDEVPGCATVRGFGADVLADAEVVELIESRFVPVVVLNNVGGSDRALLEAFGEPAFNNPVVRIVDAERRALAPRFEGPYTKAAFTAFLQSSPSPISLEMLTTSVHCFWECEARLGRIDAVRASRVGFVAGEEVVEVLFDPRRLSRQALLREAVRLDCAKRVFTRSEAEQREAAQVVGDAAVLTDQALSPSARDTKFYVKQAKCDVAGLTPLEATRLNAALRFGEPEGAQRSCKAKPEASVAR
jgi:hypothetical protein